MRESRLAIGTSDGQFIAVYSSDGLNGLCFPTRPDESSPTTASSPRVCRWHEITVRAVQAVLNGEDPDAVPPMDLAAHSLFRRSVWSEMRKLRVGQTISYGELARRLGVPGGARAVGNACGANPIPLLIPCHRVVASGGRLGGFSGGLDWKRKLLGREGVCVDEGQASAGLGKEGFLLNI